MLILGAAVKTLLKIFTLWWQHQFYSFISEYAIAFENFKFQDLGIYFSDFLSYWVYIVV